MLRLHALARLPRVRFPWLTCHFKGRMPQAANACLIQSVDSGTDGTSQVEMVGYRQGNSRLRRTSAWLLASAQGMAARCGTPQHPESRWTTEYTRGYMNIILLERRCVVRDPRRTPWERGNLRNIYNVLIRRFPRWPARSDHSHRIAVQIVRGDNAHCGPASAERVPVVMVRRWQFRRVTNSWSRLLEEAYSGALRAFIALGDLHRGCCVRRPLGTALVQVASTLSEPLVYAARTAQCDLAD